jgi:D-alanyl-D-alanine carboxypeptidase/D-alanyl-D-alanine-endopeptidase (penicillin-binding protein 4)
MHDTLVKRGFPREWNNTTVTKFSNHPVPSSITYFHTESSPTLDSISYWFLRRSINLYGEALAKTLALQKGKTASSDNGADVIRDHWKEKKIGIDPSELNMQDGSGLSPQNRVTTHAQVAILQYAQQQPWFTGYFAGFPEFNGMKLKSGTIGGAKGFCGYHTSKNGKQYIVSFIVNNYNGSSSTMVQKMYKVLDVLK